MKWTGRTLLFLLGACGRTDPAAATLVGNWDCLGSGTAGGLFLPEVAGHPTVTASTFHDRTACTETLDADGNAEQILTVPSQPCTYAGLSMRFSAELALQEDGTMLLEEQFSDDIDGNYSFTCVRAL